MPNHVHHVVIPSDPAGMHRVFKSVHGRYAQRVNRMRNVSGHLWQARYFSSPLDGQYFLNAVRYVELNPVRALMVERAHEYPWSSAAAHCGLRSDAVVDIHRLDPALAAIGDWGRWLEQGVSAEVLATIRRHGSQNLPCGSEQFVDELGVEVNRDLRFHCHGGPRTSK
jgi:putative transposase